MTTTSPLPWQPEPFEQLQARFIRALLKRWDFRRSPVGAANLPPFDRPMHYRAHVFDVMAGARLIICRELHNDLPIRQPAGPGPRECVRVSIEDVVIPWPPSTGMQLLGEAYAESLSAGRLVRPFHFTELDRIGHLYFMPPTMTPPPGPPLRLEDEPGERIRVCL